MPELTREQAIALAKTGWWKDLPADAVVAFQMFEERLCMDHADFRAAVSESLGRPVQLFEFGSVGMPRLEEEFLGKRPRATLEEVLSLLPPERTIVIRLE